MTPEEFAAALTNRLRRQGVDFRPKDVEAFAAKAWTQGGRSPDLDTWTERFLAGQGQSSFTQSLARKPPRFVRTALGVILAAILGALVGTAALGVSACVTSLSITESCAVMGLSGAVFGVILGNGLEAMKVRHSWLIGGCLGGLIVGGLILGGLPLLDFFLAPL